MHLPARTFTREPDASMSMIKGDDVICNLYSSTAIGMRIEEMPCRVVQSSCAHHASVNVECRSELETRWIGDRAAMMMHAGMVWTFGTCTQIVSPAGGRFGSGVSDMAQKGGAHRREEHRAVLFITIATVLEGDLARHQNRCRYCTNHCSRFSGGSSPHFPGQIFLHSCSQWVRDCGTWQQCSACVMMNTA